MKEKMLQNFQLFPFEFMERSLIFSEKLIRNLFLNTIEWRIGALEKEDGVEREKLEKVFFAFSCKILLIFLSHLFVALR